MMFWRHCTLQVPVTMGNTTVTMTRSSRRAASSSPPRPPTSVPAHRHAPNDLCDRLRHCLPPRAAPVSPQLPPNVYLIDRPRRSLRRSETTTFFPIDCVSDDGLTFQGSPSSGRSSWLWKWLLILRNDSTCGSSATLLSGS